MNKFVAVFLYSCALPLFSLPFHHLCANDSFAELHSADNSESLTARPIAIDGDVILFEKQSGETFTAKAGDFSAADKESLLGWSRAMRLRPQQAVLSRARDRARRSEELRVLFVGNSYSFKIPEVFARLATAQGHRLHVEQVTKGGWTLSKHASAAETLKKISTGNWDIVVLQEQSQTPAFPEAQRSRNMYPAAKTLCDAIRESGAVPVFFQTWGRKEGDKQNSRIFPGDTYAAMQARLISGYEGAAKVSGSAYVVPVGAVWSTQVAAGKADALYTRDGSHPAAAGNLLGATVFYSAIYGKSVPATGSNRDVVKAITAELAPIAFPLP